MHHNGCSETLRMVMFFPSTLNQHSAWIEVEFVTNSVAELLKGVGNQSCNTTDMCSRQCATIRMMHHNVYALRMCLDCVNGYT